MLNKYYIGFAHKIIGYFTEADLENQVRDIRFEEKMDALDFMRSFVGNNTTSKGVSYIEKGDDDMFYDFASAVDWQLSFYLVIPQEKLKEGNYICPKQIPHISQVVLEDVLEMVIPVAS